MACSLVNQNPTGSVSGWLFLFWCQWWLLGSPFGESSGSWCHVQILEFANLGCCQLPGEKKKRRTAVVLHILSHKPNGAKCSTSVSLDFFLFLTNLLEMIPQICIHSVAKGKCVEVRLKTKENKKKKNSVNHYEHVHNIVQENACSTLLFLSFFVKPIKLSNVLHQ